MKKTKTARYEIIQTTEYVEDSGLVTAYGIRCRIDSREKPDTLESCQIIPNISKEQSFVEDLVQKLCDHDADPAHLRDIVLDHLP